ncbi:hypothetical protein PHMEG_00038365 [Phytophthora megakarya]|uniref:Uncharacterized protein n=1 Tax=Phytophthora megakarya TaxID=4795 RepID=A0A225UKB1_9STRA|nr:hypothetical protein PHMEG_00038365 [Phytophthora megakarya]
MASSHVKPNTLAFIGPIHAGELEEFCYLKEITQRFVSSGLIPPRTGWNSLFFAPLSACGWSTYRSQSCGLEATSRTLSHLSTLAGRTLANGRMALLPDTKSTPMDHGLPLYLETR